MLGIVKYLHGGVTLNDILMMSIEDYATLKHAILFLGKKEQEQIDKVKKKVK